MLKQLKRITGYLILCAVLLMFGVSLSKAVPVSASMSDTEPPSITAEPLSKLPLTSVPVMIETSDLSGIAEVRWAAGSRDAKYFDNGGGEPIKRNIYGKSSVTIDENGSYTFYARDNAGNADVVVCSISNIDSQAPDLYLSTRTSNRTAIVSVIASDDREVADLRYLKGNYTDPDLDIWYMEGIDITGDESFEAKAGEVYSVRAQDRAGNSVVEQITAETEEFRAVWVSYLEFDKKGYTEEAFQDYIDTMFDNIADMNMNAVVVQVRPFGDAMYESEYFPWSVYASGEQGRDPGFDPLAYMTEAAHERGLEIHAWLNPYRITNNTTDYTTLAEDNPARVWMEDEDPSNDRNVLAYDGKLYYNPARAEVQELIINGIREIVENYDVDGIHFDDYFYPSLGSKYASVFDNVEYALYQVEAGEEAMDIVNWRRENVNTLVRNIYSAIKEIDADVVFGISPGGFLDYLMEDTRYYVDFETWMSEPGYIDYICPQIYWSFSHSRYPFDETLDRWLSYRTNSSVKVYVGIATYKAGLKTEEADWYQDDDVLRDQVLYARETGEVDGFIFFRYAFFYNSATEDGVARLLEVLQED